MTTNTDLKRVWQNAFRQMLYNDGSPAVVGRSDGTVFFTDGGGVTHKNQIWVQYTDSNSPVTETVVNRGGVPTLIGTPIRVKVINGALTAVVQQYGLAIEVFTGGGGWVPVNAHAFTHTRFGSDPIYLNSLQFLSALVRPSDPPALTVYVEPFWYRYHGVLDSWEGGNSGSFSAYVPAAGIVHFVIVTLDRSTNTVVLLDGNDVDITDPIFGFSGPATDDEIRAVTIAEKYYPLAVVHLYGGQTTIQVSDITNDLRLWGMEVGGAGDIGALFTQTVDATVANTAAETGLLSAGRGSKTMPAGLMEVGTVIRLSLAGHISTTGTPDINYRVKLNGVELASTGNQTLAGISAVGWRLFLNITCRTTGASGTVVASGFIRQGASLFGLVKTTTTTIDTTIGQLVEVTADWSAADAANTITCQEAVIEHISVGGLAAVGPSGLALAETL